MTITTGILIRPSGSTTVRTFGSDEEAAKILRGHLSDLTVITGGPSELTGCEGSLLLSRSEDSPGREKFDPNPIATALCGEKLYGPALLVGEEGGATESVKCAPYTAEFIRRALRWICIDCNNDSDVEHDLMDEAVELLGAWRRDVLAAETRNAATRGGRHDFA